MKNKLVKTKDVLSRDMSGVFVHEKHLLCRESNITGKVISHVPGYGGDVWYVLHDHTNDIGVYFIDEWEENK